MQVIKCTTVFYVFVQFFKMLKCLRKRYIPGIKDKEKETFYAKY